MKDSAALTPESLPERIEDTHQLEEMLSRPDDALVECFRRLKGDILVLGAGGKMGPTLARMARRASDAAGSARRVMAASRFSQPEARRSLEEYGVEAIPCDLLDRRQVQDLPDAENVVFMAGMKFGTTGNEALTWAMNTLLPALVCERFPDARFCVFSTGNVYGLTPVAGGGSREDDPPRPEGEYAMSALGRERIFEYFSRTTGCRASIIRLNYAVEMRYGVLHDIACRIRDGAEVDVSMGYVNVIWQADASSMALRSLQLASSPPFVLNVTGPEILSVRKTAEQLARLMNRPVRFSGQESPDALLSNAGRAFQRLGRPQVSADTVIRWTADWVGRGGASLGKPTHFEERDGRF
ncbi:MAG: NAD(P)-dependent oxidoreductase [Armatimonadota bacterium]